MESEEQRVEREAKLHEERRQRELEEQKAILASVREDSDRYDAAIASGEVDTPDVFVLGDLETDLDNEGTDNNG